MTTATMSRLNPSLISNKFSSDSLTTTKPVNSSTVKLSDCTEVHDKILQRLTLEEANLTHYIPSTNEELSTLFETPEYTSSITTEYAESVARLMLEFLTEYNKLRQIMIDEQVMTNLDLANLLSTTIARGNELGVSFAIMMQDKTIRAANERLAGARMEVLVSTLSTASDVVSATDYLSTRKAVDIAHSKNQFNRALLGYDKMAKSYASQVVDVPSNQPGQPQLPRLKDALQDKSTRECVQLIVGKDNERLVESLLKEPRQVQSLAANRPMAKMTDISAGRRQIDDFTAQGGFLLDTDTKTVLYSENGIFSVVPVESLGFRTKDDVGNPFRVVRAKNQNEYQFRALEDENGSLNKTGIDEFLKFRNNPTSRSVNFEEHYDHSQTLLKDAHNKLAIDLDRMNDPTRSITERSKIATSELSRAEAYFAGLTGTPVNPIPTAVSAMPAKLDYATSKPAATTRLSGSGATDSSPIEVDVKAVVKELESSKSLVCSRGAYSVDRDSKKAYLLVRIHPDDPKNPEVVALEVPYTDKLQRAADEFSQNPQNPLTQCSAYQSMVNWRLVQSDQVKVVKQTSVSGSDTSDEFYAVADMSKEHFDTKVIKGWESELTEAARDAVETKHKVELGKHFLDTTQVKKVEDQAEAILHRNATEAEMKLRTRQSITSSIRSVGSLANQTKQHGAEVLTSELNIDQEIRASNERTISAMQQQMTQLSNQLVQILESLLSIDAAKNALQVARSSFAS